MYSFKLTKAGTSGSALPRSWSRDMEFLFHKDIVFTSILDGQAMKRLGDTDVVVFGWRIPAEYFIEVKPTEANQRVGFSIDPAKASGITGKISIKNDFVIKSLDSTDVLSDLLTLNNITDKGVSVNTRALIPVKWESQSQLDQYIDMNRAEEIAVWSNIRTKTINFTTNYLMTQIRTRYAFSNRPKNGVTSVVMDTFFPRLVYKHKMNIEAVHTNEAPTLPKTACAISPFIADVLNVKHVPVEQLCRVMGYTLKDIRKILSAVKQKNYRMVFAGAGGTGINTLHWLTELCAMTNTVNLFKEVHIYEKEAVEVSNLFRFPIDPRKVITKNTMPLKIDIAEPLATKLSRDHVTVTYNYIPGQSRGSDVYSSRVAEIQRDVRGMTVRDEDDNIVYKPRTDLPTVIYGAPSIEARIKLSKFGNFISGTHADNSCHLWLNPAQEADIQVESYGVIQLGSFFMNQLRMAIGLMEFMSKSDIDWKETDKEILNYAFKGDRELPTDRMYNWQMQDRAFIMTEEEAAVDV